MGLVVTVQHDSREECQAELERLCRDYDWVPAMWPTESLGTNRWMARAMPKAPAVSEGRAG